MVATDKEVGVGVGVGVGVLTGVGDVGDGGVDCVLLEPLEPQPQHTTNSNSGKINCFTLHLGLHEPGGAKQAIIVFNAENKCRRCGSRLAEQLSIVA